MDCRNRSFRPSLQQKSQFYLNILIFVNPLNIAIFYKNNFFFECYCEFCTLFLVVKKEFSFLVQYNCRLNIVKNYIFTLLNKVNKLKTNIFTHLNKEMENNITLMILICLLLKLFYSTILFNYFLRKTINIFNPLRLSLVIYSLH